MRYRHDRIRVAYLSADFRGHPVSHLLAGVLECHDKSRFEITAMSFSLRISRRYAAGSKRRSIIFLMLINEATQKLHRCWWKPKRILRST